MNISDISNLLSCTRITDVNRLSGRNYDTHFYHKEAIKQIINDECTKRYVKLCETKDEEIEAILESKECYNNDQKDLIDVLYENNIVAIPLEPEIKEDSDIDHGTISESVDKIIQTCKMCINSDMDDGQTKEYIKECVKKEILSIITK